MSKNPLSHKCTQKKKQEKTTSYLTLLLNNIYWIKRRFCGNCKLVELLSIQVIMIYRVFFYLNNCDYKLIKRPQMVLNVTLFDLSRSTQDGSANPHFIWMINRLSLHHTPSYNNHSLLVKLSWMSRLHPSKRTPQTYSSLFALKFLNKRHSIFSQSIDKTRLTNRLKQTEISEINLNTASIYVFKL